jgi:hypothetical protein
LYGNFLKVDSFGFIYQVVHGRTVLSSSERKQVYPTAQILSKDINTRYGFLRIFLLLIPWV